MPLPITGHPGWSDSEDETSGRQIAKKVKGMHKQRPRFDLDSNALQSPFEEKKDFHF